MAEEIGGRVDRQTMHCHTGGRNGLQMENNWTDELDGFAFTSPDNRIARDIQAVSQEKRPNLLSLCLNLPLIIRVPRGSNDSSMDVPLIIIVNSAGIYPIPILMDGVESSPSGNAQISRGSAQMHLREGGQPHMALRFK
ncbi:hypothetical protein WR25_04043 [Diploscapter pachys]|uniref:Uncharacterized protein n=1 Tax=Diploscapter pachys TaxID=2018661 RepID=A0A2A2KLT8_9BILA|nr:hypothetical protein WR25_04043 [Diploscapter pachys]